MTRPASHIPLAFKPGDLQNIISVLIPSIRSCSWLSVAVDSRLQKNIKIFRLPYMYISLFQLQQCLNTFLFSKGFFFCFFFVFFFVCLQ